MADSLSEGPVSCAGTKWTKTGAARGEFPGLLLRTVARCHAMTMLRCLLADGVHDLDLEAQQLIKRPTRRPRLCQWEQAGFARCRLCPFKTPSKGENDEVAKAPRPNAFGHSFQNGSLVVPLSEVQEVVSRCPFCPCGIGLEAATSAGKARLATTAPRLIRKCLGV